MIVFNLTKKKYFSHRKLKLAMKTKNKLKVVANFIIQYAYRFVFLLIEITQYTLPVNPPFNLVIHYNTLSAGLGAIMKLTLKCKKQY